MNKTTEALKLALAAMENASPYSLTFKNEKAAIREALDEQTVRCKGCDEPMPKSWLDESGVCAVCGWPVWGKEPVKQEPVKMMNAAGNTEAYLPEQQTAGFNIPLYAAPVSAETIRAEALEEAAKVCDARADGALQAAEFAGRNAVIAAEEATTCAAAIRGLK
jgi:hypothetical protein